MNISRLIRNLPLATFLVIICMSDATFKRMFDGEPKEDLDEKVFPPEPLRLKVIDRGSVLNYLPLFQRPTTVLESLHQRTCVRKGLKSCSSKCAQGKFIHKNRCCTCVCRKGYAVSIHNSALCHKASWAKWSAWSKCIKTEWGGLQTRERICMSQGKETPGSCIGIGSRSKTCSTITKDFRIRKNANELTSREVMDLIQAMTKFKKDKTKKGFRNIATWHGWPFRCPWYHNIVDHYDNHCSWHNHPLFLPWHRLIIIQFELGLQRYLKNKTLGIPYWDWAEEAKDIPDLIRYSKVYDPAQKLYVKNPFHGSFIKMLNGVKLYTQTKIWMPGVLMYKYFKKGTTRALFCHNYFQFDDQESANPHAQIHNCYCYPSVGLCEYGMLSTTYSSWSPTFLLHHSAIDRVFAMKKALEDTKGVSDWTESRVVGQYVQHTGPRYTIAESFKFPLTPFHNRSMNPEIVTRRSDVHTLHKSYYYEQLFGYKFNNFNLGTYSWKTLLKDYDRNNGKRIKYWNDELFATEQGILTKKNCILPAVDGCVLKYSNPI